MDLLRSRVEEFIAKGWLIEVQDHMDLEGFELLLSTAISENVLQGTRITRRGEWDAHVVRDRATIKRVNFYDGEFHRAKRPTEPPPSPFTAFDSIKAALQWAAAEGTRVMILDVLEHENVFGTIEEVQEPYFVIVDQERTDPIKEIRLVRDCEEVRFGDHISFFQAKAPVKQGEKKGKKGKKGK